MFLFLSGVQVTPPLDSFFPTSTFTMLVFGPFLFFFLSFLDLSLASTSHTLVPRALQKLHRNVARQTHSLANDLRVALRSVLLPRAESNQHVIYCKSGNQAVFNNGNDAGTPPATGSTAAHSGSNTLNPSTSTRRPTGSVSSSATGGSSPTSSPNLPSSPWRLVNSYVSLTICPSRKSD